MSYEPKQRISRYVQQGVEFSCISDNLPCLAVFLSCSRTLFESLQGTVSIPRLFVYRYYANYHCVVYNSQHSGSYCRKPDFRPPTVFITPEQDTLSERRRHYHEMLHNDPEIPWLAILNWILRPPLGNQDVNVIIQDAKAAERTRLALRRVCKAWNAHADAMRCFVDVTELVIRGRPIELARKARVVSCRQKPDGQGPDARTLLEAMEAILSDYTQIEVIRLFT